MSDMIHGYDIIIQAGQSNAEGFGMGETAAPYEPDERVLYLASDLTASVAAERIWFGRPVADFSLSFARRYVADGRLSDGRGLLIIRAAVGGTGFSDHRWGMTEDLFLKLREMIAHAQSPDNRFVAFLWHQGENEACARSSSELYQKNLGGLLAAVRGQLGFDVPFVAGNFVEQWRLANAEICAPVTDAMRVLCASEPRCAFVDTDGLLSNNEDHNGPDDIHFCRDALYALGERYYDAWLPLAR